MIFIKSPQEISVMAEGGKILAGIMEKLEKEVKPGITTNYLNKVAKDLVLKSGAKCSFLGYEGFPACLCVSLNETIVHGVPSDRVLKEGDIISLDLGILYKGFNSDMALTLPVGKISSNARRLINVTKESLEIGLAEIKIGNTFGDIGNAIQNYVESQGFQVIRELCGHGIGRELHEDPTILNYGKRGEGPKIKEGMVFCIEPMVTAGDWKLKKSKDDFGYETQDGSLSCHFEHTIAVTEKGYFLLTNL